MPNVPNISDVEAFKYEKQYLSDYEKIKSSMKKDNETGEKWMQPKNKKIACKIFVGYDLKYDRTLKEDYKLFWDGDCKNGYAYGLGREFENSIGLDSEAIAIYSGKKEIPRYYYQKLSNLIFFGDSQNFIGSENLVGSLIQISDVKNNFEVTSKIIFVDKNSSITYMVSSSISHNILMISKRYPNFAYVFVDFQNEEFVPTSFMTYIGHNNTDKPYNTYAISVLQSGEEIHADYQNGINKGRVHLPQSYMEELSKTVEDISEHIKKTEMASNESIAIYQQYKNKICKDNIKVDFMNNDDYKSICNFTENLNDKIVKRQKDLEAERQVKRENMRQERIAQAQEVQARAQIEAAQAQKRANAWNQFNQQLNQFNQQINQSAMQTQMLNSSIQQSNQNMELQNINNNLRSIDNKLGDPYPYRHFSR